jgi:hypothetical protein
MKRTKKLKVFKVLQDNFFTSLIFRFPDFIKPFEVHIDTNEFVIKCVLMQKGHPIAFKSKKLTGAQLKWPIHEKELFAMVSYFKC